MHTIVCGLAAITLALIGASAIYQILLCKADKAYGRKYLMKTLPPEQYAEYRAEIKKSKRERSTIFWSSFLPLTLVSYYVIESYINAEYVNEKGA